MPKSSPVGRNAALLNSVLGHFRYRVDLEARTVGMSSYQFKSSVVRIEFTANSEGNKGGVVSGEEILLARTQTPVVDLMQLFVALGIELLPGPLDRVEGGHRVVDEFEEAVGQGPTFGEETTFHQTNLMLRTNIKSNILRA